MAFDGVTIASIIKELNDTLPGGRIYKIAQPENDELLLTVKVNGGQKRLFISAGASLPLIYLTANNKPADGSQFLHAAAQASAECPHHRHHTARPGTHRADRDGTSERTGRPVQKKINRGDYGQTQQYYFHQ